MKGVEPTGEEIGRRLKNLREAASATGYVINPDSEFVADLARGLIMNEQRFGYGSCPCRLASGSASQDMDIQCPCDYRDRDLAEYGQCYCGLYVSEAVAADPCRVGCIPERRGQKGCDEEQRKAPVLSGGLSHPVWRCGACGYLCAREEPPPVCPVCKARKERFERFL